ncbi:antitoxin [Nocardia sp. NPDC004068]|uniref:antitoxin n=1 Tax=Nocardia sp. NPDC004068 TaxID=3364303 RepID=UPI0036950694
MATIQVRNIRDEDAELLREAAAEEGMSLQAYMQREVSRIARRRAKIAAMEAYREHLKRDPGTGATAESILEALREIRGE